MQQRHANCGGPIKHCPIIDESFCDQCGKWVDESDILEVRQTEIVSICSSLNQGGSKMSHSKQLLSIIDRIVELQAEYIPGEGYYLDYNDLSDSDLEEATAQLMADDEDLACDALCANNDAFLRKMLPAFITHLKNPCDKDEQIEFMKIWRQGAIDYARHQIESLLEDRLEHHAYWMRQEGAA